ncbi:MAG TPA: 2Fe-2S iron-sulfur cluster binding domain-containing protein [Pseudolabrys sp.]|nr:2Fe-2S iron-sulfur cluster binding domain-containing protein [Pseudolabrys sp.]
MGKVCRLEINGNAISARRGDLLLDAALLNGVEIPYDCRSGLCGTCRVRVLDGRVFGGKADAETVYACQSRIVSDLRVDVEDVPAAVTLPGVVADLTALAPDTCEVCIEVSESPEFIPGQYYSVQFRGFPARYFSPTAPLDWPYDETLMRFHITRVPNGRVSSELGNRIRAGHRVKLEGPFGSAYLRHFHRRRLVLVASGSGFAPIWSIAEAAIKLEPRREIVLIVSARTVASLYMVPALCRLALFPNVTIVPVTSEPQDVTTAVRGGRPTDHLPDLTPHDIIFAAGAPEMVRAVAGIAAAVGAKCYSDPFEAASQRAGTGLWSLATGWLNNESTVSGPMKRKRNPALH